jgi:glycosyltransferase involved in cell wall biosynthesis
MIKKKIIIISYVILPVQFPRAYRTLELALELAKQGHDVTLYAVLGEYDYTKYEIEYNIKIRNLGKVIFSTLNSDGTIQRSLIIRVLNKLLHRFLEFPEIELMLMIPRIIKSEKNVDLLISVAKPFPIHWGCALAKNITKTTFPKIWAADCGDPYMGDKYARPKRFFYFKYVEKWFCRNADFIVIPFDGAIEAYYPEFRNKIKIIPQGFRFDNINLSLNNIPNSVPTFAYAGVFRKVIRDPSTFLDYLSSLEREFKFILYTKDTDYLMPYVDRLKNKIEIRDYVPRDQLLYALSQMDFLVNFENNSTVNSPSKLIDYALAKRPILSVSPYSLPINMINEFLDGNYQNQFIVHNIEQYNITNVTKQFCSLGL